MSTGLGSVISYFCALDCKRRGFKKMVACAIHPAAKAMNEKPFTEVG
jgi:hypothetical protein